MVINRPLACTILVCFFRPDSGELQSSTPGGSTGAEEGGEIVGKKRLTVGQISLLILG